jgi:hypothetical protein
VVKKRRPEVATSGLHYPFSKVNPISPHRGLCLGRRKPNPKKIDFIKFFEK